MRLTSEVLSNPQTCGFQIQPQDFSTPLTLQTSSSTLSFCTNVGIDAEIRACTKKKQKKNAPSILTPGEARLVGREAFEDAVGGHRERRLLLVFVRIQGFQFDLLPNFEGLPVLPCKKQKNSRDDMQEVSLERHPLIPEPRHAVHTHTREPMVTLCRSGESVLSWDSVHGSQTREIAIGGQPVVD